MDKKQIKETRNRVVVKSNELIRDVRYSLTEQEQKVVIYLISQIDKDDKEFSHVTLRIRDYCDIAGISYEGGGSKSHLKKTIQRLASKGWWMPYNSGGEILFRWIDTAIIEGETVDIVLSQSLKPFLLQLKDNFTKYELIDVLSLRGKYTIRIYELLRSYLWVGLWRVSVSELREILQCDKYPAFKEFHRIVIQRSIRDINDYTSLDVEYVTIKRGRTIEEIEFTISEKQGYQMTMDLLQNQRERLGDGR